MPRQHRRRLTLEEETAATCRLCINRARKMRENGQVSTERAYFLWTYHDHIFPEDIPEGMTAHDVREERIEDYESYEEYRLNDALATLYDDEDEFFWD